MAIIFYWDVLSGHSVSRVCLEVLNPSSDILNTNNVAGRTWTERKHSFWNRTRTRTKEVSKDHVLRTRIDSLFSSLSIVYVDNQAVEIDGLEVFRFH